MENSVYGNSIFVQILVAGIKLWIIIAPIIIIRKLNYLTNLLQSQFESTDESS